MQTHTVIVYNSSHHVCTHHQNFVRELGAVGGVRCTSSPDRVMTGLSLTKHVTTGTFSTNFSEKWTDIDGALWRKPWELSITLSFIMLGQRQKSLNTWIHTFLHSNHFHTNALFNLSHWFLKHTNCSQFLKVSVSAALNTQCLVVISWKYWCISSSWQRHQ